jgi:hypothetical protein
MLAIRGMACTSAKFLLGKIRFTKFLASCVRQENSPLLGLRAMVQPFRWYGARELIMSMGAGYREFLKSLLRLIELQCIAQ